MLLYAKTTVTFTLQLLYSLLIWKDYVQFHCLNHANSKKEMKTKSIYTPNSHEDGTSLNQWMYFKTKTMLI